MLRLGELLNLKLSAVEAGGQLFTVDGKTGKRVMRFGATTAKAVARYLKKRERVGGCDNLWVTAMGTPLKESSVETVFRALSRRTGITVHPHLLRHTFATLWLKNGRDSLMLQRLLGHTTLMMTTRYVQAVGSWDAVESHKKYSPVDRLG